MKKNSTIFLQLVVIALGIGVLALMLLEPHLEGRNINATLIEIYFKDPFLAYAYVVSISFFVALYQVFALLGNIRKNKIFSAQSVRALRIIKYCATSLVCFTVIPLGYLFIVRPGDDIAGGVFMGLLVIAVAGVTVTVADVLGGLLQSVVEMKSGNDSSQS